MVGFWCDRCLRVWSGQVPPHPTDSLNAIGEPEDSLQNCLNLVAKAPEGPAHDLSRFMNHEGEVSVLSFCLLIESGHFGDPKAHEKVLAGLND